MKKLSQRRATSTVPVAQGTSAGTPAERLMPELRVATLEYGWNHQLLENGIMQYLRTTTLLQ